MLLAYLFLINSIIWQEDFTANLSTLNQLFDYEIEILQEKGSAHLLGDPKIEGGASAWYYIDEFDKKNEFNENDVLELRVKVNNNKLRLRYYYHKDGFASYKGGKKIISSNKNWQTIQIPLKNAKPFYSGNFPYALTPGKTPSLFIFIDNLLPGKFDVEIDRISVIKASSTGGEK